MQLDFRFEEPREPESPAKDEAPRVLSVSELTRAVRLILEEGIGEVWVKGEISNYRRQASGHHYFTLKDDGSQLPCVLFAGSARSLRGLQLADGVQVQAFGELTVYEARGQYQLVVQHLQEEGLGALQARFEALKARLAAEGLFDASRKRPLPAFPARIGVVTSPTGAAIRDFLKVLQRRMPSVEVIVHPVRVQGRGAAAEIARAIRDFSGAPENGLPAIDLMVVTRGGGSLEDLWEFNEEAVARAIASSRVPVVSAVGHEIDFTLSDFAADLRAPTPSAAAELVAPDRAELLRGVQACANRLLRECANVLQLWRARLEARERSALFREPERVLRERAQRLDTAEMAMRRIPVQFLREKDGRLRHAAAVVAAHRPAARLAMLRETLSRSEILLGESIARGVLRRRERLISASALLAALSPEATLSRGFTITFDADGRIVRAAADLHPGEKICTRFQDGQIGSTVQNPENDSVV